MHAIDEAGILLEQCRALNTQTLYQSAAALASFLVGAHQMDPEVYVTYGRSLFGLGEHKRALAAFRSALELTGGVSEMGDGGVEWVELVWKIAECQCLMGDYLGQKASLESIPGVYRTLKVRAHFDVLSICLVHGGRKGVLGLVLSIEVCSLDLHSLQGNAQMHL